MSGPRHAAPEPGESADYPVDLQAGGYQPPQPPANQLVASGYQPPRQAPDSHNEPLVPRGAPAAMVMPPPPAQFETAPTNASYYGPPTAGYYPPPGPPDWMTNPSAAPGNRGRRITAVVASVVAVALVAVGATIGVRHFTDDSGHPPRPATDTALAQMVVQYGDVPGWQMSPTSDLSEGDKLASSDDAEEASFLSCLGGARDTSSDVIGNAYSPEFSSGTSSVSSSATSYRTEDDVRSDDAVLASPKLADCTKSALQGEFQALLPAGDSVTGMTTTYSPRSALDPANVVATMTLIAKATTVGGPVTAYVTQVYIHGPQVEVLVQFDGHNAPFPTALQKAVVAKVAARAAKA